jgi:signal transduction histidine kinase/DNA-binding NarL/FixJ family response regulator
MDRTTGLLKTSVMIGKIVLCSLLIFNVLVLIYFGVIDRGDVLENESLQFIEHWTVTDSSGNVITTDRSYVDRNNYEEDFTIRATLPDNIKDHEYLFLDTRKDIAVYINGELRRDFIEERDVNIPGGSVKRFMFLVPLSEKDSGGEVELVRLSDVKDEQIVPETYISTRSGALSHMIDNDGLSFFLAAIVLIFSFVVIVVSIVLRFWYKMKIDMLYGALGIFVIAFWIITDSFLFPFIFGVYHVNGIMNYILCLMIPLAPIIYLNSVQRGRYRTLMSVGLIIASVNAVLWPLLHFTGVLPFYNIRTIVNLILLGMAATAIGVLVVDAIRGYVKTYRYTFIGFFGFLLFSLAELLIILFVKNTNESLPMVAGLAFLLVFVVIQQIDDLRKIKQEKQHAIDISEAKTRFLASMSHEIRTPINAILGMNEMILRENRDPAIGEYSRNIKSSGKMLLMLVNDVLDFSKIEAGKLEISEAPFNMADMLYDVLSIINERADEKMLELKTEFTGEIPKELISDEFRIRQILVNLLSNAVKYTEEGSVTLCMGGEYTEEGYNLCMAVKDTGKGIPKEDQPYLFEAFTRADLKKNINIEGTGLGLAIVKSIVDSMKGTIEVESEYGEGSEFRVTLPVRYENKDPLEEDFMDNRIEQNAVLEPCDFSAPDAKVLAVDDNQSNLTIVKLFLERTGIKPDLCKTGDRAIDLCKNKKYDLIILDHMMPQPDGIETLQTIKTSPESLNRDTKAVVLTANAVAGSRQMYMDVGFDDYLSKPVDAKVLEQTVKAMLPPDKVIMLSPEAMQAAAAEQVAIEIPTEEDMSPIKKRLTSIEGLDYETALFHCGDDEEILEEIIEDLVAECPERVERMKKNLEADNINGYRIDAHAIKSSMATIGLNDLSERAKKHEFAAKDNDTAFILGDADDFINAYVEVCRKLEA